MTTLAESEKAKKALTDLQATVDLWHLKQKEKIVQEVLVLKNMQSLSEAASVSYIKEVADNAQELLDSIRLQGTTN